MYQCSNLKSIKQWLSKNRNIFLIWFVVTAFACILKQIISTTNNYLIFKYVFWHILWQQPLYVSYPDQYADINHYGPIFSLVIAPFAIVPNWLGCFLYVMSMVVALFYAIKALSLEQKQKVLIYWFSLHELIISVQNQQFNIMIAVCLVLAYVFVEKKKEHWSTFFIALGFFVKLYSILGLVFFFFSTQKKKFVLWFFIWCILFFVLPMFISSPQYIVQEYIAWFNELVQKNSQNISFAGMTDTSTMGMIRRILSVFNLWDKIYQMYILLVGCLLFLITLLPIKKFQNKDMQLRLLASAMLFVVLFSTGSEYSTYIISFVGMGVWFSIKARPFSTTTWILLFSVFILSSFSASDAFPRFVQNFFRAYAIRALPCTIIWLTICYELIRYKKYLRPLL